MKKLLLLLFIYSNIVFSLPTTESLFRNGDNPIVKKKNCILKFSILKKDLDENTIEHFYKIIFNFETDRLLIEKFSDQSFRSIEKARLVLSWKATYFSMVSIRDKLLHSVLKMLVQNSSNFFSHFLKKEVGDYLDNNSLLNLEKIQLNDNYAKYLQLKNDNEFLEELISPLDSEDEDQKQKINLLRKSPIYKQTQFISLVRNNHKLYWSVVYPSLTALFFHNNHRLNKLNVNKIDNDYSVVLDDYVFFNGSHELPKFFQLNSNLHQEEIKLRSIRYLDLTNSLKTILKNLKKSKKDTFVDLTLMF